MVHVTLGAGSDDAGPSGTWATVTVVACAVPSAAVPEGQHPPEDETEVELTLERADGVLLPHATMSAANNTHVPTRNPRVIGCPRTTNTYCPIWNDLYMMPAMPPVSADRRLLPTVTLTGSILTRTRMGCRTFELRARVVVGKPARKSRSAESRGRKRTPGSGARRGTTSSL